MPTITGTSGDDFLSGSLYTDTLNGGTGADTMAGGKSSDTYYVDNGGDQVIEQASGGMNDTIITTIALGSAIANVENYDFSKLKTAIDFIGNALDNDMKGTSGKDTLAGGLGNDTYHLSSAADTIIELANQGDDDGIVAAFSIDLANYANFENVQLTGKAALNAIGNGSDNTLRGNEAANVLDGKGGADYMVGGGGGDTYYVDNAADSILEFATQGVDTVVSVIDLTLDDHLENLTLASGAGNIDGTGNGLNNLMVGNEGFNLLNGAGGADTMKGGKGGDIYVVDHAGDKIIEFAGEGLDQVSATIDFSLAALAHVENLAIQGTALKATGNALGNVLHGNGQANTIDGGKGADTMYGSAGSDTYRVDNIGDLVVENAGEGVNDTIVASVALTGAFANVENYDFTKLTKGVVFTANALNNDLKSGAGADTLTGGLGNDVYYLNSAKDVVVENSGGGSSDSIATTFSASLVNYANVENLRLLGTAALKATGNGADNALAGNSGANVLDGQGGADTMYGGTGNDTYYVDNIGDSVFEYIQSGTDTVISSVDHVLGTDVENLTLAAGAGAIDGEGNDARNLIIGNASANVIDGKGGADTMKGGAGGDIYFVDHAGDKVIELAGQGYDRIYAAVDFSLAALVNVEELRLEGVAYNATGNALANLIVGNDENNFIDGGKGADEMIGGDGDDTYYVDNNGDQVVELDIEGFDTVIATAALTHGFDDVEHYDFSKAKAKVAFTGTDDRETITSGAYADVLAGGKGSDDYRLNSAGATIVEAVGEGEDTAYVSFSVGKLWDNVEWLIYADELSTKAWNATGNDLDNYIQGNDGKNILNGGSGADALWGRGGNDTLTGGANADTFGLDVRSGNALSGHDVITDFVKAEDVLLFVSTDTDGDGVKEVDEFLAGIADHGVGKDVVLHLLNGGSITFSGVGTGAVDSIYDLVTDPGQIQIF